MIWDGSATQSRDSGDPARLLSPDLTETGEVGPLRNDGQINTPIDTIPAEDGNVNWTNEAIDNLLLQSGVSPEQAEFFRQYAQSLINQNADLSDAGALGRQLQTALYSAEGFEQAVAGLERILSNPAEITDAIFREAGIETNSVQEGIAEIQRRVTDLTRRAQQYREFYRDPVMIERVQQTERLAQDNGQRGDVTFTPDVDIVRLFNARQDRSTFMHEAFGHIYLRHLERAASMPNADPQTLVDYQILNDAVDGGLTSDNSDIRRNAQERVAEMSEKYLRAVLNIM